MTRKKTYIPSKPRNPKLGTVTGTSGVGKTEFNQVAGSSHEHSNKGVLDLISQSNIDVLNLLSVVDGSIKVDTTLWATGGISAFGLGDDGGSGGGVDRLDDWAKYTTAKADYYVPASLLVPFRNDALSRLTSLESGSATSIETTGSGNAITSLTKSGSVITATKGLTFSLSTHSHDAIYKPIGYVPSWGEITDKPSTFTPSTHTHTIANVTGLQGALDGKEPSFIKNAAFNKDFGTTAGTVAQGNDSRIINGQTAYNWGNHASAGYALNSALAAHTGNTTVHITSTERTNWNLAYTNNHTHGNKVVIDALTQGHIDVLNFLSVVDGNIKVDTTLWATGGISALGLGEGGGSGGGGVDMLDDWENYAEVKADYYVPANLLVPFRDDTLSRLTSLESGSATSITTTGSGNAITSLTKSGSVITANKGLTFASASHSHAIANVTGLQTALDSKQATLIQGSNISITGSTISAVNTTYGVATTSANGLMSSTDKSKLNGIASNANNYVHPSAHPISFITGLQSALDGKSATGHTHSYLPLSGGDIKRTFAGWSNAIDSNASNYINQRIFGISTNQNTLSFFGDGNMNARRFGIQSGHESPAYASAFGILELNPFGGVVRINGTQAATVNSNVASATKLASIPTTFTGTYPVAFNVNGSIYSNSSITYTGSTNTLTATNFNGNLTGNASSASNADSLNGKNSSFFKKRYNTIIKKGIWSRILYATPIALSGSFMVSINYTRNSVVVGNVFLITFGHSGHGQITVLGTHGYTQIQARLTGDANNIYLELFDVGAGTVGDTQTATITLDAINANITTYTSFTDGTTLSGSVKSLVSTVNNRINVDGRTVAFIDDNVTGNASSATKLQTARTIWGQSFNGTGNVTGTLTGVRSITGDASTLGIMASNEVGGIVMDGAVNAIRPYGSQGGIENLGRSDIRWNTLYAVNGDFSGSVSTNLIKTTSGTNYIRVSATNDLVLSNPTAGTIYIRPNGDVSTVGQLTISSTGAVTASSEIKGYRFLSNSNTGGLITPIGSGWSQIWGMEGYELTNATTPNSNFYGIATQYFAPTRHIGFFGAGVEKAWIGLHDGSARFKGNVISEGEITAYVASDRRLKENITPITSALDYINRLNPVTYNWNAKAKELNSNKPNSLDYGLVAQEVESVLPNIVHGIFDDKYKSIDYIKLIPIMVGAIKELKQEINRLKN